MALRLPAPGLLALEQYGVFAARAALVLVGDPPVGHLYVADVTAAPDMTGECVGLSGRVADRREVPRSVCRYLFHHLASDRRRAIVQTARVLLGLCHLPA